MLSLSPYLHFDERVFSFILLILDNRARHISRSRRPRCNHPRYTIMRELIAEYAYDHYQHFGFYPADVEVNGILLTYAEYQKILAESN